MYDRVIEMLGTADASKQAFAAEAGRLELASVVDAMAALEARAVGELELAAKTMIR